MLNYLKLGRAMVDNMKSYKISQKQIDTIKETLQRYLIYVNEFCMEYADYFNDGCHQ